MASFMSDSLEKASENFLKLTKFDKLTALSRTLRDDPSCQLCSILVKYAMSLDLEEIEKTNLRIDQVPPLITLRQGIVVLSRQWKNELYERCMIYLLILIERFLLLLCITSTMAFFKS